MLRIDKLTMTLGHRTLWRDLDLAVGPGTLAGLGGPSGSGKSTLLNCIGLLTKPTFGRIEFDACDLTGLTSRGARRFRRDHLGYLFQNYALIENATVRDNLLVALRARRRRRAAARVAMDEALDRVGLAGRLNERVARLSGGEQQRVAIARLLLKQPRLVLADEPTGALDRDNTEAVVRLLRGLADHGACVLIATHDDGVRAACDIQVDLARVDLVQGNLGEPAQAAPVPTVKLAPSTRGSASPLVETSK